MHECQHVPPGGEGLADGGDLGGRVRVECVHAFGVLGQAKWLVMQQLGQLYIKRGGVLTGGRKWLLKLMGCQRDAFAPGRRFFPRQMRRACRRKLTFGGDFPLMTDNQNDAGDAEGQNAQCAECGQKTLHGKSIAAETQTVKRRLG